MLSCSALKLGLQPSFRHWNKYLFVIRTMAFKEKGTELQSLSPSSSVFLSIFKIEPVSYWIQSLSKTHISVEYGHSVKIWISVSGILLQRRQWLFSDFFIFCSKTFVPNMLWMILYYNQIIWLSGIVLKHIKYIYCHSLGSKLIWSSCSHFYVRWLFSQLTLCRHSAAWAYTYVSAWTTSRPKLQGLETCCFFKRYLIYRGWKLFKACKSVCSSVY